MKDLGSASDPRVSINSDGENANYAVDLATALEREKLTVSIGFEKEKFDQSMRFNCLQMSNSRPNASGDTVLEFAGRLYEFVRTGDVVAGKISLVKPG